MKVDHLIGKSFCIISILFAVYSVFLAVPFEQDAAQIKGLLMLSIGLQFLDRKA